MSYPDWLVALPRHTSESKMWRNAWKAIREHIDEAKKLEETTEEKLIALAKEIFPTENPRLMILHETQLMKHAYRDKKVSQAYADIFPMELPNPTPVSLATFLSSCVSFQGGRPYNDDRGFFHPWKDRGLLAGVLDGHTGSAVSSQVSKDFPQQLLQAYLKHPCDPYLVFHDAFREMHQRVIKCTGGSTAAVIWIDQAGYVYTATLGDSVCFILRNKKLIPLSCVRDWGCPREAKRASEYLQDPSILEKWTKAIGPMRKDLRVQPLDSLNVSRTLGDAKEPAISQKPKVGMFPYQAGDAFLLMTDGITDYIPPHLIVEKLGDDIDAQKLIDYIASLKLKENDNCTAVVIRV